MNEEDECTEKFDSNINIQNIELFSNYKTNSCALYNFWITQLPSTSELIIVGLKVKCKKEKNKQTLKLQSEIQVVTSINLERTRPKHGA